MKRVFTTGTFTEAQMMFSLLEGAGIKPFLENEFTSPSAGMGTPAAPYGILVGDEDASEATALIQKFLDDRKRRAAPDS